uniref:Cytochrome b5 heme-binding domain-containing protein n=1 Tax=Mesocestoides corti TaxID=53468 RepID=A0A5K3FQT4_MESCO
MWKLGVLIVLLSALLPHLWPECSSELHRMWETFRPTLLDWMNALIAANTRIMHPFLRLFNLKVMEANSSPETTKPFTLPSCLRNPIALERLIEHKHLVVLGHVFDVSPNVEAYGPNGVYAFLTGRDATRLIVSEGMEDSPSEGYALDGLTSSQIYELGDWLKLYARKYSCVGYIPGVYYSPMGDASDLLLELLDVWNKQPPEYVDFDELLPACSSFFDGKLLRLACNPYGSDQASDTLYPRQLLEPEKATVRCACVPKTLLTHARLRRYPGCPGTADHCFVKINNPESVWTGRLASVETI